MSDFDAILVVSFGGPEKPDDVIPFLENVLRGKPVPRERMLEVAEHYMHFGGVSPINAQCRELIAALRKELDANGISLPIYWGNRNWHPMLADTLREMKQAGIQRALAFVTSGYSSYSGCRQYREDFARAQTEVGAGAPEIDKLRVFYNHPSFVDECADCVRVAIETIPEERRSNFRIAFTAHSIPDSMADHCDYVKQLSETCRLVTEQLRIPQEQWKLVYQSRSGRPQDPWLEPDILDHLKQLREDGVTDVVVMPIGFLSDHMEVLFDLDHEAKETCQQVGLNMVRAATVGTRPGFISMLRELIQERLDPSCPKRAIGCFGPNHDICPQDCCPAPARPPRPGT